MFLIISILSTKITSETLKDHAVFNSLLEVITHLNTDENKTQEIKELIKKLSSDTNNISKLDQPRIQALVRIAAEKLETPI